MSKKSIKTRSRNIFEQATGLKLYKLVGEFDCQVAPHTRISFEGNQHMVGHVAASIYLQKPVKDIKRVDQTCGIDNCVLPSHLVVNGKGLIFDTEGDLLSNEQEKDTPDKDGNIHGIHPGTWAELSNANKQLAREGKYDPLNNWG